MRIGIHQPEHLPWLGFFDRINNVDAFVLLDHVKFTKNNFQNRNRISNLKKNKWEWLTIPVPSENHSTIKDLNVKPREVWLRNYTEKVRHNYSKSEFFYEVTNLMYSESKSHSDNLFDINYTFILNTLKYLEIDTAIFRSSQMRLEKSKSEMLIEICQKLGGKKFVTGIGAINYLDQDFFYSNGVSVILRNPIDALMDYTFKGQRLSILDALMRSGQDLKKEISNLRIIEEALK